MKRAAADSFGALSSSRRGRSEDRRVKRRATIDAGGHSSRRRSVVSEIPERTEVFSIVASSKLKRFHIDYAHEDFTFFSVTDETRMSSGQFCDSAFIHALWEQKNRMDGVFDNGHARVYYDVRQEEFPQSHHGSARYANRAGDKLHEVLESVDLVRDVSKDRKGNGPLRGYQAFVDCCGGPGAFSQVLMHHDSSKSLRGYGITLRVDEDAAAKSKVGGDLALHGTTPSSDTWYRNLSTNRQFTAIYGPTRTGDVYVPANLDAVVDRLAEQGDAEHVKVYVCDGGFGINSVDGVHMENLQELFSGRILLSQVLLMMRTLREGGHFVMKMFDTFSALSVSLIYAVTLLFHRVYIVKPARSRIVNSERYLVGTRMRRPGNSIKLLVRELSRVHSEWASQEGGESTCNLSPNSVIPLAQMLEDADFMKSVKDMNRALCKLQTRALKLVMDGVDSRLGKRGAEAQGESSAAQT